MVLVIDGYNFEISFTHLITWSIAIVAIFCSAMVARYHFRKNCRNTWIGNINDLIDQLEDDAIKFWTSSNGNNDTNELRKLIRKLKKITTLAGDIKKCGGVKYPDSIFIRLRQAISYDDYDNNGVLKKNEEYTSFRNSQINACCDELRNVYTR
ncbi:hypothetical protein [Morganella morganii]|uniref:hypothetical protein n=1 Tax=Morganella morganii TaxID=582 RepID=UPI001BD3BE3A|nr:hypothetical protein [Morganella morganii]MBS9585789.1 hypothetical protein [Morganella morganii subsp. morganii]QWL85572.1 hypothetical protein IR216_18695 [Morganella morganii subsp. morganii]